MKTKILAFMAFAILFTSCSDFLDEDPTTALAEADAFSKMDYIEPLLLGSITSWRNLQKDRPGLYFNLGTDEAQQGTYQIITDANQAGIDLYNGFLSQENNALAGQWNGRWPIVNVAALAIFYLESNTEEDTARRDVLLGEASFIRAVLMYELARYWGEVPVNDKARTLELGFGRQPLDVVYEQIVTDLQRAAELLPATQENRSLPTKWAAQAMLGKVYMSAQEESGYRNYNLAAEAFQAVINSGQFSLTSSYSALFNPNTPNTTESIYEWQFNNTWPDNNQIQWQTGSRAVANLDQYAYFGGYDLILPTQYCYRDKANGGIWETGDTRKNESIRYDFTYQGQTPNPPAGFGGDEVDPHIKKYEDVRTQGSQSFWNSGKNKPFLRYADVLLSYAECLNELGQTGQAEGFVNQVRTRAFGGTLPAGMAWSGLSAQQFRDQILDERMRELAFEGWRRIDLLRTGKLVQLVGTRNKWAQQNGTIADFHNRYPIPLSEMSQNDEINPEDQNPGY
ncbi:hypothetical protein AM493_07140 [Flavobacterium akiainvivens]|uniref:Carbohydrate-binding protein SusD n=1 Tax=Flavobacterium akiainvivens TaxID=1202724 RepID=A0A0M9VHQ5_9FLAO|nr:RagB/SusD family nutrient uptake outer membrane protein [Flavobacterium akiainvivens]KOS05836.1 hypothetical protein AM493_07140 [Flavobacterium akiainvivens]